MKKLLKKLQLPEGEFEVEVLEFEQNDASILFKIYESWSELSIALQSFGARGVNLPEGLSESAFCLAKNMWRVNSGIVGAKSSFDCYDPNKGVGKNRVQVKACSVLPDLTSFGPNSVWDKIFFVDFSEWRKRNGEFHIYEINTEDINNYPVNANQTLLEQKEQGRRPRFSIYKGLIKNNLYISKETYRISPSGVERIG